MIAPPESVPDRSVAATEPVIAPLAQIRTWFGVGGGASRYCEPTSEAQLARCLAIDPKMRVLGDGANLLVDDDGVDDLVVSLTAGLAGFRRRSAARW
jgi:UDP-N-acetylenolpyruvoylglucosamine reductase